MQACNCLISKAGDMWKAVKKRRKLPYYRPSMQPQANSETEAAIPTTMVQDMGAQTEPTSTTELQNIQSIKEHFMFFTWTTWLRES